MEIDPVVIKKIIIIVLSLGALGSVLFAVQRCWTHDPELERLARERERERQRGEKL